MCVQVHQHFFCVRMDMAVDNPEGGKGLTVTEVSIGLMWTLSLCGRDAINHASSCMLHD